MKIGILLPAAYRGGVLRACKNIARMVHLGSRLCGEPCDVVVGVPQNAYVLNEDFRDVHELGITVREMWPRVISARELQSIHSLMVQPADHLLPTESVHFRDGVTDFMDCDVWLLMTTRVIAGERMYPFAKIRPYAVFPFDFLEFRIPGVLPPVARASSLITLRSADMVMVTTPQTGEDAVALAGVARDRVTLIPFEFDIPPSQNRTLVSRLDLGGGECLDATSPIWVTNASIHKNNAQVLTAVEQLQASGWNRCVKVTGYGTTSPDFDARDPGSLGRGTPARLRKCPMIHKLGYLPDHEYWSAVASSDFLIHGALYDNGTYAVAEAAALGVPSTSSDYPQMRYLADKLGLEVTWFDPYEVADIADGIVRIDSNADHLRMQLPSREQLKRFSWEHVAGVWWLKVVAGLGGHGRVA
jgi:glycosyltransferase involved in cell wall biosynthesis